MQKIKLRTEESGKKLSAAYAPPKWSETAEEEDCLNIVLKTAQILMKSFICLSRLAPELILTALEKKQTD